MISVRLIRASLSKNVVISPKFTIKIAQADDDPFAAGGLSLSQWTTYHGAGEV